MKLLTDEEEERIKKEERKRVINELRKAHRSCSSWDCHLEECIVDAKLED